MTQRSRTSRRRFLHQTIEVATAAVGVPLIVPSSVFATKDQTAPSNRITLGIIGTGNQGFNDLRGFLGDNRVQIVAVCDVNRESPGYWDGKIGGREPARRLVEEHYAAERKAGKFKGCDVYSDFRELIARKDIDAVLICTPDHWHALPVITAARAGKDIDPA